jgi:hypothetical protein
MVGPAPRRSTLRAAGHVGLHLNVHSSHFQPIRTAVDWQACVLTRTWHEPPQAYRRPSRTSAPSPDDPDTRPHLGPERRRICAFDIVC